MITYKNKLVMLALSILLFNLSACRERPEPASEQQSAKAAANAEVLPFLNVKEFVVPVKLKSCTPTVCEKIKINSIKTSDQWLNKQIEFSLAQVIQDQINEKEKVGLNLAIENYVKKSKSWSDEFTLNQPYHLDVISKVASQRNQYVLIQFIVNSKKAEVLVKDRGYFFVFDRKAKKILNIQDVIEPMQKNDFERMMNVAYQKWLKQQTKEVQSISPVKLAWQDQEWFFDGEGIGIHIRPNEIVNGADQLDIFLNRAQTKQILKPNIFQKMF